MSYKPYYTNGWKSGEAGGTPITPEALNHMEAGIEAAGTHTDSTSNPHKVTAAQVGALSTSGGTLTGNLTLTAGKKIQLSNASGHTSAGIGVDSSTGDIYISNINNNWLRIKGDKTMTIGGSKVYTALDKPTPADIGAAASSHNHAAGNITSGTLSLARGGTGSSGTSVSSASSGAHYAHFAKFGNLVVCTLIPKANRTEPMYSTSLTVPSGYRPKSAVSFSIYSNINKSAGGAGVATLSVATGGSLTISQTYGIGIWEAAGTYCWISA